MFCNLEHLQKLEKMLKYISASNNVIEGKTTLADMMILAQYIFMSDKKINGAEVFKAGSPTAGKIVDKLMQDPTLAKFVKEAYKTPFLPF